MASRKVYLVGSGIASLAAAAFIIRDTDIPGHAITILEQLDTVGGSLDGSGSPESGYILRGGRMLESKYLCTFELFSLIPTLDDSRTVTQEMLQWNETMKTSSRSRLVRDGHRETAPEFGLHERHILMIEALVLQPEMMLGDADIQGQFDASFFNTNFWLMWCTTFAFQPWHSAVEFRRYLLRFSHMVAGFNRLEGILRTVYNQYDSMVRPLRKWLEARGVVFALNTRVIDLVLHEAAGETTATRIVCAGEGAAREIVVDKGDFVLVTLGSMTEGSSIGSMEAAPVLNDKSDGGAWKLWQKLALGRPAFGVPSTFADHVEKSKWMSFTTTLHDPTFLRLVRDLTGNAPGEGGLMTFRESNWLLSIVIPHQPHFIGQPEDVGVFWGYGLSVDRLGDFVRKPMSACNGREIMTEVLGHLRIGAEAPHIIATSICLPCMMPFITSQFLCRNKGDRPQVVPQGSTNLAFIGQFCELPDDVVFTVEYSVRSAQVAVCALFGTGRAPPPVYQGAFDPRVLFRAFMALHGLAQHSAPLADTTA